MKVPAWAFIACVALAAGSACQPSDREAARARAERLKSKAEAAGKQLGHDAKELGAKVGEEAQQVNATRQSGTDASPEEKLRRGAAEVNREAREAGSKLGQASHTAKVKYNLSAALGLPAASKIEVESHGSTVTLRGTVASAGEKAEAERRALATDGVAKVVNQLRVEP